MVLDLLCGLACVLPVVRREPPLVVVLLLYLRKYCPLHIRLKHHLVLHSRGINDGYDLPSLLWIHVLILLRHVFGDRYCWCLDFLGTVGAMTSFFLFEKSLQPSRWTSGLNCRRNRQKEFWRRCLI